MKKIIIILAFTISMVSCGQEEETFWKSESVTKIDNKPFWGITSSYMDMIVKMRIYLSAKNDSLYINYPFEKKVKLSDFKSLTNCKIPSTRELLDSIYDISFTRDTLKIKFYYNGTLDDENRFILNFVNVEKENFRKEVENLKKEKLKILNQINKVDLSTFELLPKPKYLSDPSKLRQLNPIQLAKELVNDENNFEVESNEFSLSKGKNKIKYTNVGVKNSDKIGKVIAQINNIEFNAIEFINEAVTNRTDAIVVSKNKMSNNEIIALYDYISKNTATNHIKQFGLPEIYAEGDSLGIHEFLAITWKTKDKVIKLAIEDVPDELWDKEIDNNVALRDNYNVKDIDKVFTHYLPLIGASEVKLFIVSNDFDYTLHLKENNPGSKTWGNMYDYTFKWRYLY